MGQEPDIFDRMAAQAAGVGVPQSLSKEELPALAERALSAQNASKTPPNVRQALQFLLAHGWLESAAKPKLFHLIAAQTALFDTLLEPLDLRVVVDDVRGLAFLAVVPDYAGDDTDESEQDDCRWINRCCWPCCGASFCSVSKKAAPARRCASRWTACFRSSKPTSGPWAATCKSASA